MPRSDYYIPVFDSLPGHKKELELREAMGWNGFESVGFLVWFWLRVAADFPNGELPGLDGLTAALRRIWKAAGLKPKQNRIQLMAEVLLEARWVDADVVNDAIQALLMHDWEDGAGMFAVKREYERDKKRRQRDAARARSPENVPGTPEGCPPDVPREKEKGKEKTIPPIPPQAGGEFNQLLDSIFSLWREVCATVPVKPTRDPKTKLGLAAFAKQLQAEEIDMESIRAAMEGFVAAKYSGDPHVAAKVKTWNLLTCAKSPWTFIEKTKPEPQRPAAPSPPAKMWTMRCNVCGWTLRFPQEDRPEDGPCERPLREHPCPGTMHVEEDDDVQ